MSAHDCALPGAPTPSSRTWRCPTCYTRWLYTTRYVGGRKLEGWTRVHGDRQTATRMRWDAEFRHFTRLAVAWGAFAAPVVLAVIVFAIVRFTS